MLKGTLRLFRVEGIPVDIHWTWLFVFVLVFWSLATNLFPAIYTRMTTTGGPHDSRHRGTTRSRGATGALRAQVRLRVTQQATQDPEPCR